MCLLSYFASLDPVSPPLPPLPTSSPSAASTMAQQAGTFHNNTTRFSDLPSCRLHRARAPAGAALRPLSLALA